MQIFLFFALFISVLAVLFAVQNSSQVSVSFLAWQFDSSLALVLLVALAIGALISFLFSLPANLKARWTIRQQRKKVLDLNTELANYKGRLEEAETRIEKITSGLALVDDRNQLSARSAEIMRTVEYDEQMDEIPADDE